MSNRNKLILFVVAFIVIIISATVIKKQGRDFPMFWKKKSGQVFIVKTDNDVTTTENVRVCESSCGKCKEHPAQGAALSCSNKCGICTVHKNEKK
jgi:hypothetical protein